MTDLSLREFATLVRANIARVIVGKSETIDLLLVALLCGGHALIEDVPGVGKTMLARALAISLGLTFRRLQCTPDLMPNDVIGVSVYHPRDVGANQGCKFAKRWISHNCTLTEQAAARRKRILARFRPRR